MMFRLTYEPGRGMECSVWEKTIEEWLVPNGSESLLVYMMRQCAEQGLAFRLELVPDEYAGVPVVEIAGEKFDLLIGSPADFDEVKPEVEAAIEKLKDQPDG